MKAKEKMWFALGAAGFLLFGVFDPFKLGAENPEQNTEPSLMWYGAIITTIAILLGFAWKCFIEHRGRPLFYIKPMKRSK